MTAEGRTRLSRRGRLLALGAGALLALAVGMVWWLWIRPAGSPLAGPRAPSVVRDTFETRIPLGHVRGLEINRFETRVVNALAAIPVAKRPVRGRIRVSAANILWEDGDGRPFLSVPAANGWLDGEAIRRGRIELVDMSVQQPHVMLVQPDSASPWNYETVLGLGQPAPPPAAAAGAGASGGLFVRSLTIQDGRVEALFPGHRYEVEGLNAMLPEIALPASTEAPMLRVAWLRSTLLPDSAPALAVRDTGTTLTFPSGRIGFEVLRLQLGQTVLADARGIWDPGAAGWGLTAMGHAEHVDLANLHFLGGRLPRAGTSSFVWAVQPMGTGVYLHVRSLELRSEGSHVSGSLAALIGNGAAIRLDSADVRLDPLSLALVNRILPQPLPYSGEIRGRVQGTASSLRLSADASLGAEGARREGTAHLTGLASMTGAGLRLHRLDVNLDSVPLSPLDSLLPLLPLAGRVSGHVGLVGRNTAGPLELDSHLETAGGAVVLTGTVAPNGTTPSYDLDGRLIAVDVQRLLRPKLPDVAITSHFTLRGQGLDPSSLQAELKGDGRFSGWYTGNDDQVQLDATARDGLLTVHTFSMALGPLGATASGTWGLRPDVVARGIDYRIQVRSLSPFGAYLPGGGGTAAGTVDLNGTATGTLQRPNLKGTLRLQEVRYGAWAAGAAEGDYSLALGDSIPVVQANVAARGVDTRDFGAFEAASVRVSLTPPTFSVAVKADRVGAGIVEVNADGSLLAGGERIAHVHRLVADLGNQRWSLKQTADVRWGGAAGVVVHDVQLTPSSGAGKLSLEGTLYPLSKANATFDIAALPAAQVQTLLGRTPRVEGLLWASGKIMGGPSPVVDVKYQVRDGRISGISFEHFQGSLAYDRERIDATAALVLSPGGRVNLQATLPVRAALTESPSFRWVGNGTLSGTLVSDSLPLALLDRLVPDIRKPEGVLRAQVKLSGTPDKPRFTGSVEVTGGAVTVTALDRRFEGIHGILALDGERAHVTDLEVRADGTARVSGAITFEQLSKPVADLTIRLNKFRAFGMKNQQAAASSGEITVKGPIPHVVLGGRLSLNDGNILVPQLGADQLQQQVEQIMQTGAVAVPTVPGATVGSYFFGGIGVQGLTVVAGDNLWFEMEQARAQLAGDVTVDKSGDAIKLRGTLSGEHGTFTLQAGPIVRRFQITSAQIRFFGEPEPNPGLQITATRVMYTQNTQMEIIANVGGTARNPTLSLSTSEGVQIPESEVLSVLLFGQQSFGLGGGLVGQGSVSQTLVAGTLIGGAADVASMYLEQALVQQLGVPLDYFQVRTETGSLGLQRATVVVGKELGNNVFLTVDAGIGSLFGEGGTNAVGASLEWHVDQEWTLDGGIEPVIRRQLSLLGFVITSPLVNPGMQYTIDLTRRWTY